MVLLKLVDKHNLTVKRVHLLEIGPSSSYFRFKNYIKNAFRRRTYQKQHFNILNVDAYHIRLIKIINMLENNVNVLSIILSVDYKVGNK